MSTIRHVCNGHEYRYNTITGEVTNNYGSIVSVVRLMKYAPTHTPFIYRLFKAGDENVLAAPHLDMLQWKQQPSDNYLARWAISHTAFHLPESK